MSDDKTKDLILEEARREYDSWIRANRNLNTKASIFIGVNTFIIVAVINLNPPKYGQIIILSLVGISTFLYFEVVTHLMGFDPDYYSSTEEFMKLSNYDREELQEELIYKYGTVDKQRESLHKKSRFLKWGFRFMLISLGSVGYFFLTSA